VAVRIQMRRGSTSDWNTADPILNEGEIGYNTTLGQIKIGDGSTVWSSLDYMVTDAELTTSLGNYIELTEKGAVSGVAELDENKNVLTRESVIFEGATTNSYQTTLITVDPTADRTITLPDSTGTVVVADVSGNVIISGNLTVNGTTTTIDTQNLVVEDKNITIGDVATPTDVTADGGGITLKGTTDKTFNWVDATDSWTSSENINLASGKTYFKNGTDIKDVSETLTNKTISGTSNTITNVANTSLTNSSITINGTPVSLGGSINIAGDIEGVTAGTGLSGGGTSGTVTLSVDTAVVATTNNTLTMSGKTLTSPVVSGLSLSDSSIIFEGSSADEFETTLTVTNPTADRTITLPNVTGTVITTGDTGTVTNTMLAGSIANDKLSNSAITINGTAVSLGGSISLPGDIEGVTAGTGLTGGGTSGTVTLNVDTTVVATTNNTLTLSNKTIALGSNTVSGTTAQFNSALTDGDFATIAGTETLTNKTLTNPVVTGLTLNDSSIVFEGSSADANETTLTVTNPTADRTITLPDVSGTVVTTGDTGTVTSTMIADGTIVNADINATAAIAVSKLAASTISGVTLGNNLNALTIGTGLSGTSYNGSSAVTVAIDSTVATTSGAQTLTNKTVALGNNTISGTIAQFNTALTDGDFATLAGSETLTNKTLGSTTTLGANLNANSNKITSLGTPTASTDAATKQYVDDLAQGLHIHASVVAATTANLTATYANGSSGVGATLTNSGTQAALVIDGVTLSTSDRVLVKNQTAQLQNGIYTVTNTGSVSTNWVLTRATDMDESVEIDGGDFVFVTGGTAGDNTGWVQTSTSVTVGTTAIIFTQFSGAGTYLAGNGLTLTGNTFSIDTTITANLSGTQTLTNKTIALGSNTVSGTVAQFNSALTDGDFATLAGTETLTSKTFNLSNNTLTGTVAQFNTALSDGDFATLAGTETLTSKTINLSSNTLTGTIAQFNTALSDGDFATLAGSETFTNKTLTSPVITGLTLNDSSIIFEGSTADAHETTLTVTNPTADRTITLPDQSGTVALQGFIPASLTWGDLKNGKSA